jgi:hypothetical protein
MPGVRGRRAGDREVLARVKHELQLGSAPVTNGAVVAQVSLTGGQDAIDASVVCLAQDGDDILTSDPDDLLALSRTAGVHVELIPV